MAEPVSRSARDGRSLDILGHYDPRQDPIEINVDAELLEQVLINLLRNSIDALGETARPQIRLAAEIDTAGHAIIAVHDPNAVRMPERMKAGRFVINGISLAPIEKTVENGRKIVAFRTEKTVAAIRKALAKE